MTESHNQSPSGLDPDNAQSNGHFISIETIREKLKKLQFRSIEDFDKEMQAMFTAWTIANGT